MKNQKNKGLPSTQKFVPIAEIRNDCLVMRDGSLRAILMVSSINFALKSADEQEAIISAYMQFLNTFDYPLQIMVQSRKFNIDKYLDKLAQIEKEQTNDLLKIQIAEYRNYVKELIEIGDIMTKKFYVTIPYDPLSDKRKSFWSRITEIFSPVSAISLSQDKFAKRRHDLWQRVGQISSGLNSIGLASTPLDTQSLIELFYNSYNPDMVDTQKIKNISDLQVEQ